jgi:hypothetical protein
MKHLEIHPRVAQQGITEEIAAAILVEARPQLVPFRDHQIDSVVALLDWDHHLPSRALTLRMHVCYDEATRRRLEQAFQGRSEEIAARNHYPEFDVSDFGGLPADESYDVELTPDLSIETIRLVSPWRREIAEEDSVRAIAAVRASDRFAQVQQFDDNVVAPGLAELEAVAWTPPCESDQTIWTLDVWWLTSFDGRLGRGWSFLVDLGRETRVLTSREFTVRAG